MSETKLGRPATEAKEQLMLALIRLVVRQGFSGTSVTQICDEASVSKGAFFHHFESKEVAALACLDFFFEWRQKARESYLREVGAVTSNSVLHQVDFELTPQARHFQGCFLGVMALETSRTHSHIRERCQKWFQVWRDSFAKDLALAAPQLTKGQIHQTAAAFVATYEGGLMLTICAGDPSSVRDALGHFKSQLQNLITAIPTTKRKALKS
jgi:TetR/AcrR family transcriptional regulator, transcriptional repressor for nem operon